MALTFKSIGKAIKKGASVANPLFGAAYDAIGGKGAKDIAKNYVQNNMDGAKIAAAASVAAPMLGAAGGASGAAGAAGGAAGKASLGSKLLSAFNSPLGASAIDLVGNVAGGIAQGKMRDQDRGEERRQFDLTYGLNKGKDDREAALFDARRAGLTATTPMRQALLQQIMQRFGMGSGAPSMPPTGMPPAAMPQAPMPQPDLRAQLLRMMTGAPR